jgi:hypothetical protein
MLRTILDAEDSAGVLDAEDGVSSMLSQGVLSAEDLTDQVSNKGTDRERERASFRKNGER